MKKKIGVLGGTYFIGYHLVQKLLKDGHEVTIFHRGKTNPPEPFIREVTAIHGNRIKQRGIDAFFSNKYDTVFDLTAYWPEHVEGIIGKHAKNIGHYVFCSTSSVVLTPPRIRYTENESLLVREKGTYGGNKTLCEETLRREGAIHKVPVTIFRPQGVIGPNEVGKALYVYFRSLNKLPLVLPDPCRDRKINFVDVRDLAHIFSATVGKESTFNQIYNVAGDHIVSLDDFVELCSKIIGIIPKIQNESDGFQVMPGWHDYDLVADNTKVKKEFDFTFTPLEQTLIDTWNWYSDKGYFRIPLNGREKMIWVRNKVMNLFGN